MKRLEAIYGHDMVESVLAMMGGGWTSEDSVEDILLAGEDITREDAELIHEIMERIEEVDHDDNLQI